MAKRSRRRNRTERAYTARSTLSATPHAPPPFSFSPIPSWAPLYTPRSRAVALAPPVTAFRTVRPYLMRTVRTDTNFRFSPPNRRPSPDVPNRALARSKSWTTFPDTDLLGRSSKIPLQRAATCARRSIRREVLLALGRGNGAGSRGVPKSKLRCTR